jgi:hypothetical protein
LAKRTGRPSTYREELQAQVAGLVGRTKQLEQALAIPLYDAADRKKVLK